MAHSQTKPPNPETIQAKARSKSRASKAKPVPVALCEAALKKADQIVAVGDVNDANLDEPFEIVFAEEPKPCERKKKISHLNSLNHTRSRKPNPSRKRKGTPTSSSSPARRQR